MTPIPSLEEAVAGALLDFEEYSDSRFGSKEVFTASNPSWGLRNILHGRDAKHSGDCTKQPWTCCRCVSDDYLGRAQAALTALKEAGYAVVPREPTEEMNEAAKPFRKGVGDTAERLYRAMIQASSLVGGLGSFRPQEGATPGIEPDKASQFGDEG